MAYLWKNLKCSLTACECQISTPSLAFARCKWTCSLTARECQINTPSLVFARCKWTLKIFSQVFTYSARMLYYIYFFPSFYQVREARLGPVASHQRKLASFCRLKSPTYRRSIEWLALFFLIFCSISIVMDWLENLQLLEMWMGMPWNFLCSSFLVGGGSGWVPMVVTCHAIFYYMWDDVGYPTKTEFLFFGLLIFWFWEEPKSN